MTSDLLFRPPAPPCFGQKWLFYIGDRVVTGLVYDVDRAEDTEIVSVVIEGQPTERTYEYNPKTKNLRLA